jgi:hypothetical protein
MKRLTLLLALIVMLGPPALAQRTVYISPDVPTDDPGAPGVVFLPWDVVAYNGGVYNPVPVVTFPMPTAVDAIHKMDKPGNWLFSVEANVELPPGGGVFYEPEDVIRYDGLNYTMYFDGSTQGVPRGVNVDAVFLDGDDNGNLVVSFDVPTTIGGTTYDPADLVKFSGGGHGPFFDASVSGLGVALSDNVTGADQTGGDPVLAMDVPSDLLRSPLWPVPYLPGQIAIWDGVNYNLFLALLNWPLSSEVDAFSCQANPGRVYERVVYQFPITMKKSPLVLGNIVIDWTQSCSSGAEDYGIYEGTLVRPWAYNHLAKLCTDTGANLSEDFTPQAADSYYLVVPHNLAEEGSYGRDYDPTRIPPVLERPPAVAPPPQCGALHVATPCP